MNVLSNHWKNLTFENFLPSIVNLPEHIRFSTDP